MFKKIMHAKKRHLALYSREPMESKVEQNISSTENDAISPWPVAAFAAMVCATTHAAKAAGEQV